MDYGKSGAPKRGGNTPRHSEHNAPGTTANPFGRPQPKAALVEKLRQAATKASSDKGDKTEG